MKKKSLVLLIIIWGVLLASLIYLGIYNSGSSEVRFGKEDTIVSVTGTSVQSDRVEDDIGEAAPGESDTDLREGQAGSEGDASESPAIDKDKPADDKSAGDVSSDDGGSGRRGPAGGNSGEPPADQNAGRVSEDGGPADGNSGEPPVDQNADGGSGDGGSGDGQKAGATSTPAVEKEKKHTCSFTIECRLILDRKDLWRDGLEEVVPGDGVFFSDKVRYKKGQSVYDILKKICDKNDILLDADYTPLYDTYYVRGIGNLYEFDCGSESGWKYKVNGVLPGVGSSLYEIKDDDEIVFFYDIEIIG